MYIKMNEKPSRHPPRVYCVSTFNVYLVLRYPLLFIIPEVQVKFVTTKHLVGSFKNGITSLIPSILFSRHPLHHGSFFAMQL